MTRRLVFLTLLLIAFGFRCALGFSTHHVLDWDETYYLSLATNAARGGGLYPYIFGFAPMPIMGGMGYATYSYALAVKLAGPTIFAPRAVSLCAAIAGIAGIWVLVRTWYGDAAAWIAAAITASLRLFMLSNSARMDAWTFAYTAWALVAFATAFERPHRRWPQCAAGFVFGLGLQVHIDVLATGLAGGFVYLVRRPRLAPLFAAGAAAGVAIYAAANILPNPAAYYVTTVLVRVDATGTYAGAQPGIVGSFLNPRVLIAKEMLRYRHLWTLATPLELVVFAAAYVAMLMRRNGADAVVGPLAAGTVLGAAVILNNASPLYYIHVLPALIVPVGALFTHGAGEGASTLGRLRPGAFAAAAVVAGIFCASASIRTIKTMRSLAAAPPDPVELIATVRRAVNHECRIAGDGTLYVPYFADYWRFVSLQPTEVKLGMLSYRTSDEAAYWEQKQPDAVFSSAPLSAGMQAYVNKHGLAPRAAGLWLSPAGCR